MPSYASGDAKKNKERCHLRLLNLYMKKVPKDTLGKDAFYLCPLGKVSDAPGSVWYTSVPLGKNMLRKMLPTMCEEVEIVRRTNHSWLDCIWICTYICYRDLVSVGRIPRTLLICFGKIFQKR